MKVVVTSIAALGLMAAPLAAQEASTEASTVKTAGVAQNAQVAQALGTGLSPVFIGVGFAAVVIGGAVALSNAGGDGTPSTPSTPTTTGTTN